ncbi:MAG TPA: hypothetical protein VHV99_22935 [Paraburkholderia sp.]|nr:hypothetical protein [Paraburkholderia sp.]
MDFTSAPFWDGVFTVAGQREQVWLKPSGRGVLPEHEKRAQSLFDLDLRARIELRRRESDSYPRD